MVPGLPSLAPTESTKIKPPKLPKPQNIDFILTPAGALERTLSILSILKAQNAWSQASQASSPTKSMKIKPPKLPKPQNIDF